MTNDLITACAQIAPSACDGARIVHLMDQERSKLAIALATERAYAIIPEAIEDDSHPLHDAACAINNSLGCMIRPEIQRAIIFRLSFMMP